MIPHHSPCSKHKLPSDLMVRITSGCGQNAARSTTHKRGPDHLGGCGSNAGGGGGGGGAIVRPGTSYAVRPPVRSLCSSRMQQPMLLLLAVVAVDGGGGGGGGGHGLGIGLSCLLIPSCGCRCRVLLLSTPLQPPVGAQWRPVTRAGVRCVSSPRSSHPGWSNLFPIASHRATRV